MKIQNLDGLMVSASEVKKELPEIMTKQMTKVIVKNNVPVSVIMPYDEYVAMNENQEETKSRMVRMGQNFTMDNGVEVMVVTGIGTEGLSKDGLSIKMFYKMKNSDDLKLFHTFNISAPSVEGTYTSKEMWDMCEARTKEKKLKGEF